MYLLKEVTELLPKLLFREGKLIRRWITVEKVRNELNVRMDVRAASVFISNILNFLAREGLFARIVKSNHIQYVPRLSISQSDF